MDLVKDTHFSIHVYADIKEGRHDDYRLAAEAAMLHIRSIPDIVYYNYSFSPDRKKVYIREGYKNAEAVLHKAENCREVVDQLMEHSVQTRLECHCTAEDWAVLGPIVEPYGAVYYEITGSGTFNRAVM